MVDASLLSLMILAGATLASPAGRTALRARDRQSWILDGTSLAVHTLVLPALQVLLAKQVLDAVAPGLRGALTGAWAGVVFYLLLDWAWYWNHRVFHADTPLWSLHAVHHSAEQLDVFVTARNSIPSHLFMVYFWFIGAALHVLADPSAFLLLATLGGIVNYWGHTPFNLPEGRLARLVEAVLITPRDHAWHHSAENPACNFGTVLSVWDRLHGSLHRPGVLPQAYGTKSALPTWKQLLFPAGA